MDFTLSVLIAGIIAMVLLYASLYIYYRRLQGIKEQLTTETHSSLQAFGLSIFSLGLIFPTSFFMPSFIPFLMGLLLFGMIGSQLLLVFTDVSRMRPYTILTLFMALILLIVPILNLLLGTNLTMIAMVFGLLPLIVIAFFGAVYVIRESPNPFTISMMVILVFAIIATMTYMFDLIAGAPQFFILQVLPVAVGIGVTSSMLRPWRNIIVIAFATLVGTVGPALFIPALLAGNMPIFLFAASLTVALTCMVIPLTFFMQQAVDTKSSTAFYITMSLISIGVLALTHGNNFAIANSAIGGWDETILFLDWVFGVFAVACFTMSAISSSFSDSVRRSSREIIIAFGSALIVLGHPIVRWVEVEGVSIQRWELDPLYLGVLSLLGVAFIIFFKMSYHLWKVGSGRAGLRFVFFMFAALFLGIVAMFSDMIPIDLIVPLFLVAGIMLAFSSPRRNPFAKAS